MTLATELKDKISKFNLLQHPFYQAWMNGTLPKETLKHYAVQYFPHVKAFPRFVSAIHSQCESHGGRKILLENLLDEEGFGDGRPHPELWVKFGEGLGLKREDFENIQVGEKAKELVEQFWTLCRSSYAEGLGALYSYECQIPEIAKAKIMGLKEQYNVTDPETLEFFSVHEKADEFHSDACAQLLDNLPSDELAKALKASEKAASALWDFLTEVHGSCH